MLHATNLQRPKIWTHHLAGTWQYDNATAISSIKLAFAAGFRHIDTAESYQNQVGVGQAPSPLCFSRVPRLPTLPAVPGAGASGAHCRRRQERGDFSDNEDSPLHCKNEADCKAQSLRDVALDLKLLGLDYVDLILLHGTRHSPMQRSAPSVVLRRKKRTAP